MGREGQSVAGACLLEQNMLHAILTFVMPRRRDGLACDGSSAACSACRDLFGA